MIDLDSCRKLSDYSNFETRSLFILERLKRILNAALLIPSKLKFQLLMEIGRVPVIFLMVVFL